MSSMLRSRTIKMMRSTLLRWVLPKEACKMSENLALGNALVATEVFPNVK